jgi:hypothetical protein
MTENIEESGTENYEPPEEDHEQDDGEDDLVPDLDEPEEDLS